MVVVLNSHTQHNWEHSAVELSRLQNFHLYLSAAAVARSALSADKTFVALGSRLSGLTSGSFVGHIACDDGHPHPYHAEVTRRDLTSRMCDRGIECKGGERRNDDDRVVNESVVWIVRERQEFRRRSIRLNHVGRQEL
jgi:hypothetical protein